TVVGALSGAIALVQSDNDAGSRGVLRVQIVSGTFQSNEILTGSINGIAESNGPPTYAYAANDVLEAPTYVSPGLMALTIDTDGHGHYSSAAERETALNIKVFSYSGSAWGADDIDWINNDSVPGCSGITTVNLIQNVAMTELDLDDVCVDAESDVLTSSFLGTLPAGVAHNGSTNVISGTPTLAETRAVRFVVADPFGA